MNPAFPSQHAAELAKLKNHLINLISRELENNPRLSEDRHKVVSQLLHQAYSGLKISLPTTLRDQLFREIMDELLGFGILQPLLDDPEIKRGDWSNRRKKKVYIEKKRQNHQNEHAFEDDAAVMSHN